MSAKKITIANFLRTDFRDFALYDVEISIPSMIDGLKISQRKAMWTVLNNPKKMTVEQLGSLAASYTNYHHGATNLEDVIAKIARDYCGSNNVNWLVPEGQFGNILDHKPSSSRYISTKLHPNWNKWFNKAHNIVMPFVYEDGEATEPQYFIPPVPTILFNGADGIGTGYASSIFGYNPDDVLRNTIAAVRGKSLDPLVPWYNGYAGKIERNGRQTVFYGAYEKVNATTLRITQLPIGVQAEDYKLILNELVANEEIKDYDNNSTEKAWDITIYANRAFCSLPSEVIIEKLRLVTRNTENIVVWDEGDRIRTFNDVNQLIQHFVKWRLGKYEEYRLTQIELYREELAWLEEKLRFIHYFIEHSATLVNMRKDEMLSHLTSNGFVNADRLVQIRVYNLTLDETDELVAGIRQLYTQIDELEKTDAKKLYLDELKKIK